MADKVLRIKALTDPSDAVAGLAVIGNSLEKVGSAALATAGRSKGEWKALEEEWRKADPTLRGVADAAFKVESALNKAAKVEDVSRLASELVKAQQAVDLFAARLKQVEQGGGVVDEKTLATLAAYEDAVTALKGKMELLAAAQDEATAKIKGGQTVMSGLAAAAEEATSATAALSSVKGPEQLEGAIKRGAWASLQLREELDRAAAAGEKIDDETVKALKAVEAQTQSSIEKMTRFRKEMGDAGENAKVATDKLDALKGASGGLGSAFDSMEKSGTGVTKAIGSFGIALGAMGAAIAGAVAAGKELGEGIDKLSAKYAGWQQKKIDAELLLQRQEIALRAADRGLIEHGKTIAETVENYDKYALSQGKLSEGARKVAEEIGGLKIPPTYENLNKQVEAIGLAFEGAYKRGEEFGDRMLLDNASVIEGLIERYEQLGKEVPEDLAELAKSLELLKGAGEAAAEGIGASAEKTMTLADAVAQTEPSLDGMRELLLDATDGQKIWTERLAQSAAALAQAAAGYDEMVAQLNRLRDAQAAASNFSGKAPEEFKQIQDAAVGAAAAAGQFGDDLDRVAEVVVKTGGSMTVGAPMFIQIARASDEARASIRGLVDEMHRLNEASASVFEQAPGWEDYLVALRTGFNSGITSLTTYIDQLNAFEYQLRNLFAGAGAEAKSEIEKMISAIEALKDAAMSGKDGGSMSLDQLVAFADSIFRKNK